MILSLRLGFSPGQAFIMDPEQIEKIFEHLKKKGRAPPIIAQSSAI